MIDEDHKGPPPEPSHLTWEEIEADPKLRAAVERLEQAWRAGSVTLQTVGGISDEELDAAYACACIFLSRGDIGECLKVLALILLINPNLAKAYTLAGICAQRSEALALAVQLYDMALALDEADVLALGYRGECRVRTGDRGGAVADLEAAVRSAGSDPKYRTHSQRFRALLSRYGS